MEPFGADDFTDGDMVDRGFVGDTKIKIPPFWAVPQEENGTKAEAGC